MDGRLQVRVIQVSGPNGSAITGSWDKAEQALTRLLEGETGMTGCNFAARFEDGYTFSMRMEVPGGTHVRLVDEIDRALDAALESAATTGFGKKAGKITRGQAMTLRNNYEIGTSPRNANTADSVMKFG